VISLLKRLPGTADRSPRPGRSGRPLPFRPNLEGLEERSVLSMTPITSVGYPYSAVVHIFTTFPDGTTVQGSGTMMGPTHVLTAGHCLYSAGDVGFARQVRVYAEQIGNSAPFGVASAPYDTNDAVFSGQY
jgi:hypothetical protein